MQDNKTPLTTCSMLAKSTFHLKYCSTIYRVATILLFSETDITSQLTIVGSAGAEFPKFSQKGAEGMQVGVRSSEFCHKKKGLVK